jgi:hypothetical protein
VLLIAISSLDLRSEINATIESMENPEERLLLKYRYLKNESWDMKGADPQCGQN